MAAGRIFSKQIIIVAADTNAFSLQICTICQLFSLADSLFQKAALTALAPPPSHFVISCYAGNIGV